MSPLQRAAGPVWAGDGMCEGGLPLTFRDVRCPSLVRQRPPARHPDTPPALPSLSPYLQSQRGKEDGLKMTTKNQTHLIAEEVMPLKLKPQYLSLELYCAGQRNKNGSQSVVRGWITAPELFSHSQPDSLICASHPRPRQRSQPIVFGILITVKIQMT
ncbi:hypothetical protein MHYP_G00213560 [Metynnis hypsauchen]